MMQSVFSEKFIKYKKKTKAKAVICAVLIAILAAAATLLIIYSGDNMKIQFAAVFTVALFEIFFIALIFIIKQKEHLQKITNLAGKNLCWQIDDKGILLQDTVEGRIIEKSFLWNNVKYVHMQCYTKQPIYGGYLYGLLFVIDSDKFHTALKKREKKPSYHQKDEELDGGFFIVCEMEFFQTVEGFWGKNIR
ncbi:MAG: hypothetical protein JXN65_11960 [Clostridia bacterium]|nr:hypothetical protein [Clostridia bacterium]